jgi:hypothetical protein
VHFGIDIGLRKTAGYEDVTKFVAKVGAHSLDGVAVDKDLNQRAFANQSIFAHDFT